MILEHPQKAIEAISVTLLSSTDLRGGAALIIGALASKGQSIIENIGYIDRGYENIERSF